MSVLQEFQPWRKVYGFVVPEDNFPGREGQPCEVSGNGLLYTSEFIIALFDNGELNKNIRDELEEIYRSCERLPGLMIRTPVWVESQEALDDYIGCATASYFIDGGALANRILEYGINFPSAKFDETNESEKTRSKWVYNLLSCFGLFKVKRVYNNVTPGNFTLAAWLGRFPAVFAHLKFACGKKPTFFEKLFWIISVLFSLFKKNEDNDSFILTWHLTRVAEGKSKFFDLVIWLWRKLMRKKRNGTWIAEAMNNPPLRKWLANSK